MPAANASSPGARFDEIAALPLEHRRAIEQVEQAQRAIIAHKKALDEPRSPRARKPKPPAVIWKRGENGTRALEIPGVATFIPSEYEADRGDLWGRLGGFLFFLGLSGLGGAWRVRNEHDKRFALAAGVAGFVVFVVSLLLIAKSNRADAMREGRVMLRGGLYMLPDGILWRGADSLSGSTQFFPRTAVTGFDYARSGNRTHSTFICWHDASGTEQRQPVLRDDVRPTLERWLRDEP